MSMGLLALLDDVAALAKVAAASLDDVAAQATKAGAKAAGVVIDDAAVTPRYVTGFAAARELPIIGKIAMGSLRNKLMILLPAALALSMLLPELITPLLMMGGVYLSYEGTEKVYEVAFPHAAHEHEAELEPLALDEKSFEAQKVASSIRTDFILSAEIMVITLGTIPAGSMVMQAIILAVVGIGITMIVYGVVALIVKADDLGIILAATRSASPAGTVLRTTGRSLVQGMPYFLRTLGALGTAAMVWVGGGIILHGLEEYGLGGMNHAIHDVQATIERAIPTGGAILAWFVGAIAAGIVGLIVGLLSIPTVSQVLAPLWRQIKLSARRA